jgi:hypothetical protein
LVGGFSFHLETAPRFNRALQMFEQCGSRRSQGRKYIMHSKTSRSAQHEIEKSWLMSNKRAAWSQNGRVRQRGFGVLLAGLPGAQWR